MIIEWAFQTGNDGLIYQLTQSVAVEFISWTWVKETWQSNIELWSLNGHWLGTSNKK